jgi:hypothetical protein
MSEPQEANAMRYALPFMLTILAVSLGGPTARADSVLLQDDFNDNSLDPSKWTVVLPNIDGTPGVTEQNQHIELTDRGYLVTANQYDPSLVGPLTLTGTWTFNSATNSFQQEDRTGVITRSDAVPYGPPYGEVHNGVGFFLHMDGPSDPGKMFIVNYVYPSSPENIVETPIQIHNRDSLVVS